jgi:hypothetical protein
MQTVQLPVRYVARNFGKAICIIAITCVAALLNSSAQQGNNESESQVQRGFAAAPVHLNLDGKNRALVGLGSYLINVVAQCNDCHTSPTYSDNPFNGDPGVPNIGRHLAGGRVFPGGVVSRNLTPDVLGRPAGLSFSDFREIMRTGIDDDKAPPNVPSLSNDLLQVMPWPSLRKLTDNDLGAMYEYLRAIPCVATPAGANGEPPAHSCT